MRIIALFAVVILSASALEASVCVSASRANLRSGPSVEAPKTWEVYQFMPLQKIKEQGAWAQVRDVDGDVHWIQKRFLSNRFDCAVVRQREARLRSGPGTNFGLVRGGEAKKYYSYRIFKRQGNWVQVIDSGGGKGWIHRDSLWIQ
jgi:SH3-like domain-containing protein